MIMLVVMSLGLGICYNGDAEDEGAQGYGFNPPCYWSRFLSRSTIADPNDGLDNDRMV